MKAKENNRKKSATRAARAAVNLPAACFAEADVACLAHQIWEQEGCPEGRALAHWLQAEAQLKQGQPPAARG